MGRKKREFMFRVNQGVRDWPTDKAQEAVGLASVITDHSIPDDLDGAAERFLGKVAAYQRRVAAPSL